MRWQSHIATGINTAETANITNTLTEKTMASYMNTKDRKPRPNERHEWSVVPTLPKSLQAAKELLLARTKEKEIKNENRVF